MKRLKLAAIGCGARAQTYLSLAAQMPQKYEIVAAADPVPERVEKIKALADNPDFRGYSSAAAILAGDKLADVMIIATQDRFHFEPCKLAMEKGYDILLEKPISPDLSEVHQLQKITRQLQRRVVVCHVLRYTEFYGKVKEIIDSGVLGNIITLNASEGVLPWHQAHSYVRGHWANVEKGSPMIVAKSSHDMDIIHWLIGERCTAISSFGALTYFTPENAPAGAPERCTDGCPIGDHCMYNAKLYAGVHRHEWLSLIYDRARAASDEEVYQWLKTGPWGRCVYRCDNTAVDHQVVSMQFKGNITATFTMTAFEHERHLDIFGTEGILKSGKFYKDQTGADIIVTRHDSGEVTRYRLDSSDDLNDGHYGGDKGLMTALYDEMNKTDTGEMHTSLSSSVHGHEMAFAAEKARLENRVVQLQQMKRSPSSMRIIKLSERNRAPKCEY
ncbi:MAG TPA: Gfo/Idh/MocA family oxidoreductase [Bacteroidetes bacterium]|nr:Gfo/Idh/MocA family oxidoreductase [Bacteroidota bacterium]